MFRTIFFASLSRVAQSICLLILLVSLIIIPFSIQNLLNVKQYVSSAQSSKKKLQAAVGYIKSFEREHNRLPTRQELACRYDQKDRCNYELQIEQNEAGTVVVREYAWTYPFSDRIAHVLGDRVYEMEMETRVFNYAHVDEFHEVFFRLLGEVLLLITLICGAKITLSRLRRPIPVTDASM
ncbi:hypothetical protein [Cohaesibacter gelatinilyticus]|jgi:hypothetical protein|uniref:Uncharacterized protein n=1 Tax=Cohaesibacter gelatinilyticus TaxID=372072 RepID=A0A285PIW7_9HYPH|nr:hypothetical protein [Cohaesibacter gelatinilyticus]SNZ21368.1 hypothetical protein SAMN06265368_4488 [Cohaesibacter gelatinilyticus]